MEMFNGDHLRTGYVGRIAFLILFFIIGGFVGTGVGAGYESARIAESQKVETAVVKTAKDATSETADWKTYTDSTYYYSIKYPTNWEVKKITPGPGNEHLLSWQGADPVATAGDYLASVRVSPKTVAEEVNMAKSEISSQVNNTVVSSDEVTFNTYIATSLKMKNSANGIIYTTYYITHNGKTFIVNGLSTSIEPNDKIAQTVANSFKFTDWKTYTSEKFGFSFEYPKDWVQTVNSIGAPVGVTITSPETIKQNETCSEGCGADIDFYYYASVAEEGENKANKYGATTVAELVKNPVFSKVGTTTLGGVSATDATRAGLKAYYNILVEKNGHLYEVFFYHKDSKSQLSATEKQILASFKFTDLKTYTSEKYGFSFEYPSKWTTTESSSSVHTNCQTVCVSTTFANSDTFWLQVSNLDGYTALTDKSLRGYVEYTQGKDGLTATKVGVNEVIKMSKTNPDKSTETLAGFFLKSDSKVIEVFGTFTKTDTTKMSTLDEMLSTFKFTK